MTLLLKPPPGLSDRDSDEKWRCNNECGREGRIVALQPMSGLISSRTEELSENGLGDDLATDRANQFVGSFPGNREPGHIPD